MLLPLPSVVFIIAEMGGEHESDFYNMAFWYTWETFVSFLHRPPYFLAAKLEHILTI
jgi:hypothetical protein